MADKDVKETQAQLDLQMQINQVLQGRISILKAQEKALSGQVQMAVDLCKALKCDELDKIEERLKTARDAMKDAADQAAELGGSLEDAADAGSKEIERKNDLLAKMNEQLTASKGAAVGLGIGLVRGLGSAFQTAQNLTTGIFGVVGSLGKMAASIVSLPFKLLGGLFELAQGGGGGGPSPIRLELEKIRGEFGSLSTGAGKVAKGALSQFRGEASNLAGTGLTLRKVFGGGPDGLAKALAENVELMKALGPAVDNFSDVLNKSAVALSMYRKGLGMTTEQQAKFMKFAQAAGKDPMKEMNKFASQAINMGESFGISSKFISKDMAEMQSDFAHFGGLGPKVMSQISVYTRKLGIEIKDLNGLIDGFDDFEGAAQGAAKLSQAFGMNVDAMKMMQEQDPAARLSMLQQAFKQTGKSIEQMSRQEKKLLAQQSGLSEEAASLAFSQRGLSMSYDQVQKAGSKSEKKQLSQAEAMSKLADSIERVFGSGGSSQFKSFFDSFSKGFQSGIMKSMEFKEAMRAIRGSLRAVYRGGVEVGKMFVKMFPGIKDMLKGIKDLFSPDRFKRLMGNVKKIFGDFFKDLRTDPKAGVEKFLDRFKELFKKFFSSSGPGVSTLLEGGKTFIKTMGSIFKALLPIAINGFVTVINKITELLKNPPKMPSAVGELFSNLVDAMSGLLSTLWQRLAPPLGKMFIALFQRVGPWLAKGGVAILAVSLGKVILSAVMTGLGGGIAAVVAKKIADFFGAAFTSGAGEDSPTQTITQRIGDAFSGGVRGIIEGMKSGLKTIAEIPFRDIAGAAARLFLMTVLFLPTLLLFAAGVIAISKMFDMKTALTAVLAFTAIGVAAYAISLLLPALNSIKASMIGQAILGAVLASVLIVSGVLIMAGALRLIASSFNGIDWMGVAVGMGAMALVSLAIVGMVYVLSLLGMDGGTMATIGAVGALAAVIFLGALLGLLYVLKPVQGQLASIVPDPKPYEDLAIIMLSIAAMAASAVIAGAAAIPALYGLPLAALFVYGLGQKFIPYLTALNESIGSIDFGKTAVNFVKIGIIMVALAAIAAAATVAGYLALTATAGLVFIALFVQTMGAPGVGLIDSLAAVQSTASGLTNMDDLIEKFKSIGTALIGIGAIAGLAVVAGVLALAGVVPLLAVAAFLWVASKTLMPALNPFINALTFDKNMIDKIYGLKILIEAVAELAALSALMSGFTVFSTIFGTGFGAIRTLSASLTENIPPFITALNSINADPAVIKDKLQVVSDIIQLITGLSGIAQGLGEMDTGVFGDSTPQKNLKAAGNFIDGIFTNVEDIINKITNLNLSETQVKSASAVASVLGSIGEFVKSMQPSPELLSALKNDSTFGDDTPGRIKAVGDHMKSMIEVVRDNIKPIFDKVIEATAGIADPAALEPKIKILSNSFSVLGSFSKVIADMSKDVAGTDGSVEDRLKTFTTLAGGITNALFANDTSYVKKAFDGIKAITDGITDASSLEPKIKAVASVFDIISKFASVLGDMAKLMPEKSTAEGALGESSDAFATRVKSMTDMVSDIVNALVGSGGGAITKAYTGLSELVSKIPNVQGGKLREFERKGKALAGIFDVLSKFTSAIKDISSLGATKEGAINPEAMTSILNSVNSALFNQKDENGNDIGGALQWITNGLLGLVGLEGVKELSSKGRELKSLSSLFKVLGDFAVGITSIKGIAGADGDMKSVKTMLTNLDEALGSAEGGMIKNIGSIATKFSVLQATLANSPLNTRNLTRLTAFSNGLNTAMTAFEHIASPSSGISGRVKDLADTFTSMRDQFVRLSGEDSDLHLAVEVGRGLARDGRVTIRHEAANISLNVKVTLDAAEIGKGVIKWSRSNETTAAPRDERFVLTDGSSRSA